MFTGRESNHYPLTMQATPGPELGFRIEYDTEVFDAESVDTLIERLQRVLVAMTTDPAGTGCPRSMCSTPVSAPASMRWVVGRC